MIWVIVLLILIIIIATLIMSSAQNKKPTIWNEYIAYLRSGQKNRIPHDLALQGWNIDAKRFASRNNAVQTIPGFPESSGFPKSRICSWNVHTWKKANGVNVGAEQIERDINYINADILCLQEYVNREDISAVLDKKYPYKVVQLINGSWSTDFGNAIYSKQPITEKHYLELPVDPEANEKRICLMARIGNGTDGMWIMNAHLEVRNSYPNVHKYRYPQLDCILSEANKLQGRVIILGDFNVGNLSKMDKRFHQNLKDNGWSTPKDAGVIYNNTVYNSNMYGGFVDHIYFRKGETNVYGFYEYFTDASDHYPVIIDSYNMIMPDMPNMFGTFETEYLTKMKSI